MSKNLPPNKQNGYLGDPPYAVAAKALGARERPEALLCVWEEKKVGFRVRIRALLYDLLYDYFDASINRIAAWVVGFRSWQKALLAALCTPNDTFRALQETAQFTELMVKQEEWKTMPFGDIWEHYCEVCGAPADGAWLDAVKQYETDVLLKR